jgi:4'-phosphopantetheinyl transferase
VAGSAATLRVWQAELRRSDRAEVALRTALGMYLDRPPESLAFALGPGGKPELAGPAGRDVHFSLSHSGDRCAIAVSEEPVGIDVEEIRELPELEGIVRSRFAPDEAAEILTLSGEQRLRAFYRCWTRKEAYLKATGAGIGGDSLQQVEVSTGSFAALRAAPGAEATEWSLLDLDIGGEFAGALATRHPGMRDSSHLVPIQLPLSTQ